MLLRPFGAVQMRRQGALSPTAAHSNRTWLYGKVADALDPRERSRPADVRTFRIRRERVFPGARIGVSAPQPWPLLRRPIV
jgi:hypothetical protein